MQSSGCTLEVGEEHSTWAVSRDVTETHEGRTHPAPGCWTTVSRVSCVPGALPENSPLLPRQLVGPRPGVPGTVRRVGAKASASPRSPGRATPWLLPVCPVVFPPGPSHGPHEGPVSVLGCRLGWTPPCWRLSGLCLWKMWEDRGQDTLAETLTVGSALPSSDLVSLLLGTVGRGPGNVATPCRDNPGDPCPCSLRCTPMTPAQRPLLNRRTQGRSRSPTRHVLTSHGRPHLSRTRTPAVWA